MKNLKLLPSLFKLTVRKYLYIIPLIVFLPLLSFSSGYDSTLSDTGRHRFSRLTIAYQSYQHLNIFDLGSQVAWMFNPLSTSPSARFFTKFAYQYEQRNFFKLHHYFATLGVDHFYFNFQTTYDYAHSISKINLDYENNLYNSFTFKTKYLDVTYFHTLAFSTYFNIIHGSEIKIWFDPNPTPSTEQYNHLGIRAYQHYQDYRLQSYLQFAIDDFWSDFKWLIKLSYLFNPREIAASITLLLDESELSHTLTYQPSWGVKNRTQINLFQQSFTSNSPGTKLSQPPPKNNDIKTSKNFLEWWRQITPEILEEVIKNKGISDGIDEIWIKSIIYKKKDVKKIEDLLLYGLDNYSQNYHYYLVIKAHLENP